MNDLRRARLMRAKRVQVDARVEKAYALFKETMVALDRLQDRRGVSYNDNPYGRSSAQSLIIALANLGHRGLFSHILEDRDIPKKDLKKVERALKTFNKMRRAPNKPGTWWEKNRKQAEVLYNTRTYHTRDDEDANVSFDLEGFKIFNTIRAEGQEMDEIRQIIERSVKMMRRSGISIVPKLLYGKIKIVDKISKGEVLAWYNTGADDVSLRTRTGDVSEAIHSLIHELGHRWWTNFLGRDIQNRWQTHHRRLKRKPSQYPLPDVGDPLGMKLRGISHPIVSHISERGGPNGRFFKIEGHDGKGVFEKSILKALKVKNFPTRYAATDVEEHFCESFAMYCLGTLLEDHTEAFEEIVLGVDHSSVETAVLDIEESSEPEEEFYLDDTTAEALLADMLASLKSKKSNMVINGDIGSAGFDGSAESVGVSGIEFDVEGNMGTVNFELTFTIDLNTDEMSIDADPDTFDNPFKNKTIALQRDVTGEDLARTVLRLLSEYEDSLIDMIEG